MTIHRLKLFSGVPKYNSASTVLMLLGLLSCNTLLHNHKVGFLGIFSDTTRTVVDAICLSV